MWLRRSAGAEPLRSPAEPGLPAAPGRTLGQDGPRGQQLPAPVGKAPAPGPGPGPALLLPPQHFVLCEKQELQPLFVPPI